MAAVAAVMLPAVRRRWTSIIFFRTRRGQRAWPERRAVFPLVAALLAGGIALGPGCSELPEDLLVIAPPHYGPGTAELRVVVGPAIDRATLEVTLDREPITARFGPAAESAHAGGASELLAEVEVGEGEHEVVAVGRLKNTTQEVTHRYRFSPPPALGVVETFPPADSADFGRSDWVRLTLSDAAADEALDSIRLRCGEQPRVVAVHRAGSLRIVVDPREDLPPDAHCRVLWRGREGPRELRLATGPAGPPVSVSYDRRSARELAPFPDDFWLVTNPDDPTERGIRVRATGFGLPDQWLINALVSGVRPLDGFSPIAHFTLALSAPADPASLPATYADSIAPDASVLLFDATEDPAAYGTRVPFRIEARSEATRGPLRHALLLFPSVALESGHRYALVVTRRVRSAGGEAFGPSTFFAQVRDSESAGDWALARARELAEDVFAVAATAAIPVGREDVAFAARFTIRSLDRIPDDLEHIRAFVAAAPPPPIHGITVEVPDPDEKSELAAIVRGDFSATHWLDAQSRIARDPDSGLPRSGASRRLRFTLALPRAALAGPVPVVMYQHGNPGNAESEVIDHARRYLAAAGFAVIGFDDYLNRETRETGLSLAGRAGRQVAMIMIRILASSRMPEFFAQTVADQIAFIRAISEIAAIPEFRLPVRQGGADRIAGIDPAAPLVYLGISEGAHHGSMLLPFAPEIRAAALVSPGRRFSEVLVHQNAEQLLAPLYSLGFGRLSPIDIWVSMALIQMIFDDQDPNNFAPYLYREPLGIAPSRRSSVLITEGLGDSLVPNHATHALARAIGRVAQMTPRSPPVEGLERLAGAVAANVDPETTAVLYPFVPQGIAGVAATPGCASPPLSEASAHEGHYCVQSAPEAIRQRVDFLRSAVEHGIPRVDDPLVGAAVPIR